MDAQISPRQQYVQWVEDRIEDFKSALTRDELLSLADQAVHGLFQTDDGQYPLTEILLKDAVDALIFQRLHLPTYRQWLNSYRNDTPDRPSEGTSEDEGGAATPT
ncbi:MAG TPA: hypothetical protein VMM12_15355 [Longimicrobiales bacterium]|nr:hypothetical protein [Longimicrobiales bacterium]